MYNTKFCKITHLKEKDSILCKWKQFCNGDDYRNSFHYALELIKENNITTWITDTSNGFESKEADTRWLLEEFMPQMIESSVSKIIFIIAKDSPLRKEIREQEVALKKFFEVALVEKKEIIS